MTPHSGIDDASAEERISVSKCPQCTTNVLSTKTNPRYCGLDLIFRVCPYCETAISKVSDPCEVCGRYEPTEEIYVNYEAECEEEKMGFVLGIIMSFVELFFSRSRR